MKTTLLALTGFMVATAILIGQEPPVYRPGNGVSTPTLVQEVKPYYTPEAKAAKIQGTVLMTAVIREDGTVGETNITRSLDTKYGLDGEAVKAAKQWTFKPGMKDGKPVPVLVTIEIAFTLKSDVSFPSAQSRSLLVCRLSQPRANSGVVVSLRAS